MPRLFIGIKCVQQAYLTTTLADLRKILVKSNIKWAVPENFHLTLKFLGEVRQNELQSIIAQLDNISTQTLPITILPQKTGYFGSIKQPSVIWFGYQVEDKLSQLQKRIDEHMYALGFKLEEKKFTPHVTLGRVNELIEIQSFNTYILNQKPLNGIKFQINAIQLIQSILHSNGPQYMVIKEFSFGSIN
jgi:2'-5' RNA ligase